MSEPEKDPRTELADIARSVRALVEWQELCGASGLVSEASPSEVLAFLDPHRAPSASPRRPETSASPRRPDPSVARNDPAPTRPAAPPHPAEAGHAFAGGARTHNPEGFADTPVPVLSIEEKVQRLSVLQATVRDCKSCVLCERRKQTVFARGDASAELCFIGEGPGADEDEQGEPFVGKAGQLLDKMIAGMGMQRNEVYICNIVKCRPPENREPLPAEVAACSAYLAEQLEIVRPKVIVTLGNVPLKALFNVQGIMKLRGTWRLYKGSVPVMPTYHPAYVLRNPTPQVRGDVWNDLKLVMKQLGRAVPPRKMQ